MSGFPVHPDTSEALVKKYVQLVLLGSAIALGSTGAVFASDPGCGVWVSQVEQNIQKIPRHFSKKLLASWAAWRSAHPHARLTPKPQAPGAGRYTQAELNARFKSDCNEVALADAGLASINLPGAEAALPSYGLPFLPESSPPSDPIADTDEALLPSATPPRPQLGFPGSVGGGPGIGPLPITPPESLPPSPPSFPPTGPPTTGPPVPPLPPLTAPIAVTPEPSSLALLSTGIAVIAGAVRRRARTS